MVDHALLADPRWRALRAERDLLVFRAAFALLLVPAAVSLPIIAPIGSALGHGRWDAADLVLAVLFGALSVVFGLAVMRGAALFARHCEGRPRMQLQAQLLRAAGFLAVVLVAACAGFGLWLLHEIGHLA